MNTTVRLIKYIPLLLLISLAAQAQKKTAAVANTGTSASVKAHIIGKGKAYADKISLRWNTDSYKLFNNLVMGGVFIDRLVIGKDNKAEAGGWKRITTDTVKALALKQFDTGNGKTDTAKVIVAQGLYGKSTYPKGGSLITLVKLQDMERQNRHLIVSLYSAISPAAAASAGLAFDDQLIPDTNKKYVYRVYPAKHLPGVGTLDTGFIYVVGHDRVVKEVYQGLIARGMDRRIRLQWPKKTALFTGYFIERSNDKSHFKPLNKQIYLPQTDTAGGSENLVYLDSVTNYQRYYYRLVGINSFGERHVYQEIPSAIAVDRTGPKAPELRFTRVKDQVTFTWKPSAEKDLKGYYLLRGKGVNQMDTLAEKTMLPSNATKFQLTLPPKFAAAYFRLLAADTAGNFNLSDPVYVFNHDSIPPAAPMGLTGSIDKKGMVNLKWAADKHGDVLRGYKIFTANSMSEVFSAASNIIPDTAYTFATTLKTLTKNMFVKIVAVDVSFNHSKYSQIIKLSRPDTIAPPQPVIGTYTNNARGININWSKSTAADFSHYLVYRRLAGDTAWANVQKTRINTYADSTIVGGKAYEYSVRAVDSSGVASNFAFPLYLKTAYVLKPFNIGLNGNYDSGKKQIIITWNKPTEPVKYYILYKDLGQGLVMYKSVPADKQTFSEEGSGLPNRQYGVKVVYANNAESEVYIFK